jgi:hypothetical protein
MILYQQHIMWYESKMINETLDSLQKSLKHSTLPVKLKFCLNSQTYLEKPIEGKSEDMFQEFINHPVLKEAEIIYKTDSDNFYNIGDWRREIYSNDSKYTVWGESDCLIPEDYFYILSNIEIRESHILSLASRKMGDDSWGIVEFEGMEGYQRSWPKRNDSIPFPLFAGDYIDYPTLNKINNSENIDIIQTSIPKIDGALLALSPNLPEFIPKDLHFAREDYCANLSFIKNNIPQYVIKNRIKGHNYNHPLKRTNTVASREDSLYKDYETKSYTALQNFVIKLKNP